MQTHTITFGTTIKIINLNNKSLNKKLINFCKKIKKHPGRQVSNIGGFQSNLIDEKQPLINDFFEETKKHIVDYVEAYDLDEVCVPKLSGLWFNINGKKDFNKPHIHLGGETNASFSAAYYLKVPKNSGKINFINPDPFFPMNPFFSKKFKFGNSFNSLEYWVNPKEMDLIIFPSSLFHYVDQNLSDEERISLSFNIKI
jgi:uncharacterized protein (TIGR02466 family)